MSSSLCGIFLLLTLAISWHSQAAPSKAHVLRFHPISRAQYDAILETTAGQPVVSEARLISSGLQALNELRTHIEKDVNEGWHRLLNLTGLEPEDKKRALEGYPLCVVKTIDLEEVEDAKRVTRAVNDKTAEPKEHRELEMTDAQEIKPTTEHINVTSVAANTETVAGKEVPEAENSAEDSSIINCIVVMRARKDKDVRDKSKVVAVATDKPKKQRPNIQHVPYHSYADYGDYDYQAHAHAPAPVPFRISYTSNARPATYALQHSRPVYADKPQTRDNSQLYYRQYLSNYYSNDDDYGYPYGAAYPHLTGGGYAQQNPYYNRYPYAYNPASLFGYGLSYTDPLYAQAFFHGAHTDDSEEDDEHHSDEDDY